MNRKQLIDYIVGNDIEYKTVNFSNFTTDELVVLKDTIENRNISCFSMKAMDMIFNSVNLI
jgi:hypothetical protein